MESELLKKMYDLGEQMCQAAKDGGYNPESDSEEMDESASTDESSEPMGDEGLESIAAPKKSTRGVETAMAFMKR